MFGTRQGGWRNWFSSTLGGTNRGGRSLVGDRTTCLRLEPLEARRLLTMDELVVTAEIARAFDTDLNPVPLPLPGQLPGEPVVLDVRFFVEMKQLSEGALGFGNLAMDLDLDALSVRQPGGWTPNNQAVDHDGIELSPPQPMFSENADFGQSGQDLQSIIVGVAPAGFGPAGVDPRRTIGQNGPVHVGSLRVEWDGVSPAALHVMLNEFSTYDDLNQLISQPDGIRAGIGFELPYSVGSEFRVNTFTAGDQRTWESSTAAVAVDGDGDSVVTWSSQSQDGSGWGVFAQRYDVAGEPVGPEYRVNRQTSSDQLNSVVAMDADGDHVIVWSSLGQDGDDFGVYGQRYNAAGIAQGGEFRINEMTAGIQHMPHVAMGPKGDFVVTWTVQQDAASDEDIYARRFDAHGVPLGNEFLVNSTSSGDQRFSAAAVRGDGAFLVTWSSDGQDGDDWGVYGQRYDAAGQPTGGEFLINTQTAGQQFRQHVDMARDGRFVVAWVSQPQDGSDDGIYAQRFHANGTTDGLEFRVNVRTTNAQRMPRVAMGAGGGFVVAWNSNGSQDGDGWGVFQRQFDASGAPVTGDVQVNEFTLSSQFDASVAMDDDGDLFAVWSSLAQDGDSFGVYARRYELPGDTISPVVAGLFAGDDHHHIHQGQRLVAPVGRLVTSFSEPLTTDVARKSVTDLGNWTLLRDGADVSDLITGINFGINTATNRYEAVVSLSAPLADGGYTLQIADDVEDLFGNSLDGDYDGEDGDDFVRHFRIATPLRKDDEFQVNTFTTGDQRGFPIISNRVGVHDDGSFVIAWTSIGQTAGFDVYAQRFDAAGQLIGGEFRVNTTTVLNQRQPSVAVTPDGGFIIGFHSSHTGDFDAYARRYDAMGQPLGNEFRVNTTTARQESGTTIGVDQSGGFVIGWHSSSDMFNQGEIFFQRYSADGTPIGGETQVNTFTVGDQQASSLAMAPDGSFVITWKSEAQDGSSFGIYARRFDADGRPRGGEFRANTTTGGSQEDPTAAMDDDGDFVITWGSQNQDGSGFGVYAQRYNAAGVPVGPEFRVNQFSTNDQKIPRVFSDADGDLVVAWASLGQDGSDWGIYARRINAEGQPQGDEFRVNTTTNGDQNYPMIGGTRDGDFIIAWSSFGQDGDGEGIFAQRFGVNLPPVPDAGGPYIIAEGSAVQLNASASTDPDSAGPLAFAWDLDNDGQFDDATGATPNLSWAALAALGIADDGVFAVAVQVSDAGGQSAAAASTLTVNNTGPSPLVLDPLEAITEGGLATLSGSFTDPGTQDEHTLRIDWGDGAVEFVAVPLGDRSFATSHMYLDDDPTGTPADNYTIVVELTDDDGGRIDGTRSISVSNLPPQDPELTLPDGTISEGGHTSLNGVIIDPGSNDSHLVEIDWGDGTSVSFATPAGLFLLQEVHFYADDNPSGTPSDNYTITVTITDDDGGSVTANTTITVNNVAPDAMIQGAPNDGQVQSLIDLTSMVVDPGTEDTFSYDWQLRLRGNLLATAQSAGFAFTPLDEGLYEVTLTVTDDDGGVGMDVAVIDVGPCQVPGDANGDCVVDIDDLNAVRNNFGATGLGAVDLSFNSPVPGTIRDRAGLGTGFTHRLPGTGGALPENDPNLDLEPGAGGRLLITSTVAHLAAPASAPLVEAPGVLIENIGSGNFAISAAFQNVDVPNGSDQLMLYVGANSGRVIRAGFHDPSTYAIAVNDGGVDTVVFTTGAGAFTPGDDVLLSFRRVGGEYVLSWQNATNPAASGNSGVVVTSLLDFETNLYMGIVHSSPNGPPVQTATVDSFNVDLLSRIPGDTNGDFIVDVDDLNAVRNNFGAGLPGLRFGGPRHSPVQHGVNASPTIGRQRFDLVHSASTLSAGAVHREMRDAALVDAAIELRQINFDDFALAGNLSSFILGDIAMTASADRDARWRVAIDEILPDLIERDDNLW